MNRFLAALLSILLLASPAGAGSPTQIQIGIDRTASPSTLCVMSAGACVGAFGTVNTSTGAVTHTGDLSPGTATVGGTTKPLSTWLTPGAVANTLAAGNDSRIVNALQPFNSLNCPWSTPLTQSTPSNQLTSRPDCAYFYLNPTQSGGTSAVQSALHARANVGANVANQVWTALFENQNFTATPIGNSVAMFAQGFSQVAGGGPTWAGIFEAGDRSGSSPSTTHILGIELDIEGNGPDTTANRYGLVVVPKPALSTDSGTTIQAGIRIGGIKPATIATGSGSISGYVLNIDVLGSGSFAPGALVAGSGVTSNTTIVSQISGAAGGVGTYQISISQSASETSITATANVGGTPGNYATTSFINGLQLAGPMSTGIDFTLASATTQAGLLNAINLATGQTISFDGVGGHTFSYSTGKGFLFTDGNNNIAYSVGDAAAGSNNYVLFGAGASSAILQARGVQGTSANFTMQAFNAGSVLLGNTGTGIQARITDSSTTAVDYLTLKGSPTTTGITAPTLGVGGTDTTIPLVLAGKGSFGVISGAWTAQTADPTTTIVPAGYCVDWNNTTAGTYKHVCNFGGTLRSVSMN